MNEINIRFASKAEAQELIPGNTQYYNRLKQMDIDWRARKENATLDELIGFTVMDHDIEFPEGIGYRIMANPDVDHIAGYAEFDIDGKKRKCALVPFYRMSWDEACDEDGEEASFFNHIAEVLIPLDDLSGIFDISEASDFWDKMGGNTDYVNSPEECLAVNFSYAIIFGLDGGYYTPQLIKSMLDALKG